MRKTYLLPQTLVERMETALIICGSQDVNATVGDDNIGYGGIDEEGQKEPSSRRRRDVWDDDEAAEE